MKCSCAFALTIFVVLTSLSVPAQAQWQWRDANGRMVISDRPPPREVPARNIIKAPPGSVVTRETGNDATPPAPVADGAATAASPAAKTAVERDLESRKRRLETAEAAKKAEEAAAEAKEKQQACAALRSNLAALEGGQRILQVSEKGERSYMDDSERISEIGRVRQQIAKTCS